MFRPFSYVTAICLSTAVCLQVVLADGVGTSKCYHGPTGLQLYSLRDMQQKEGVAATLDKAQAMGFKYVEVAALGNLTPAEFKAQLDRRGLVPIGMHCAYDRYCNDVEGVVRDAKALGLPYVGCAWIPHEGRFSEKACLEAAAVFNRAGKALARHGIKFYYHTHGYEFEPFGQGTLFDLLVKKTNPGTVYFQMDVMWVVFPGQDPVRLLEKFPGRWLLMHLKDLKKGVPLGGLSGGTAVTNDVAIGTGQVNWPKLLQAAQKVGVKYYFIEDESPTSVEQIPHSLRYLESVEW